MYECNYFTHVDVDFYSYSWWIKELKVEKYVSIVDVVRAL